MNTVMCTAAIIVSCAINAIAGHDGDSTIWVSDVHGSIDSGRVISFPVGSSDYFNVAHDVEAGIGNSENIVDGLPVTGIAVSVADFGSGVTYPRVGIYQSNLALDSSGATPDLTNPISSATSPALSPPPLFQYSVFDLPEGTIPAGATRVHAVVQLPPSSGLLGLGADSNASTSGSSAYTSNGYATPAVVTTFLDLGLNVGQDNRAPTSCKPAGRRPNGRLRASLDGQGIAAGDHLTLALKAGDPIALAFFGTKAEDKMRFYMNAAPCTPTIAIGPVLSTSFDGDGDGSFLRVATTWPQGFGGQTLRFSAAWGNAACANPGAGFTNCVTLVTAAEPPFGVCDDGTIESSWVAQIPSGSSDYFSNSFGVVPPTVHGIVGFDIAVQDFGTAVPAYPTAGVSLPNLAAGCNTPDLTGPGLLACVCPFTFPPGTTATTSGQYVGHSVAIPSGAFAGNCVIAWLQFPPGDSGLLGCGADSSSGSNRCSFFTLDGYSSPPISFFVNWGIRLATN